MPNHIRPNKRPNSHFQHITWQPLIPLLIIALALYIIIPQIGQFRTSFSAVQEANVGLLALAILSISGAVMAGSGAYAMFVLRRTPFSRIATVQWAGMFINRLLPAGIGGMGLMADFLYRHGHSLGKASTVVMVNNFMGGLAHASLLVFAYVLFPVTLPTVSLPTMQVWVVAVSVLVASVGVFYLLSKGMHTKKVRIFFRDMKGAFAAYRYRKRYILGGYGFAVLNTGCHALAMSWVLVAFGYGFEFGMAMIVLSGSVAAATASPTPGGLLGAEAGITAVLMAFGIPLATAFAVALTYRFSSYWVPILPGIIAFLYARGRRYI